MTSSDQSGAAGQPSGRTIEVLYFDGCPSYEHAVSLVRQALAAEQLTAPIQLIRVETDAEAQRHRFYGSPTIRINGEDIAPLPAGATPRLACRVYRSPDGQLAPVPTYETLVAALRRTGRNSAMTTSRPDEHAAAALQPGRVSRRNALKAGASGLAALLTLSHITPALADELAQLAGHPPMTGPKLAGILRTERARWNALLAQVRLDRMDVPGVEGEWSVKELVAHLTWYEQAIVEGAEQALRTGTFTRRRPEGVGLDEMNERIAQAAHARPAADVLAEADAVFGQLLELIAAAPQEMLNDPRRLGLPEDMVPWMGVANNSYAHYREHEPALRVWLEHA
jgi:hypothetical protein